jgi:hypothetical protein
VANGQIDVKRSCKSQFVSRSWKILAVAPSANNRGLIVFEMAESRRAGMIFSVTPARELFVDLYKERSERVTGNHLGTKSFVPAKRAVRPFYDAAVSTAALDVRPDFRFLPSFAIWPSPLFFASADRVAAYSGATIG